MHSTPWQVNCGNPNDDWLYQMRNSLQRQCQFLVTTNLAKPPSCRRCNGPCEVYFSSTRREIARDGILPYRWKRTNEDCKKDYHFLDGSFIPNQLHMDLFKHIQMIYKFYCKRTATQAAKEMNIHPETVKKWFRYYRNCISHWMQNHFYPYFQFDVDVAIEFDEAKLSAKQKFHKGRSYDPVWVLGGIQGRLGYVVLKVVDNRNGPLLQSIISSVTAI